MSEYAISRKTMHKLLGLSYKPKDEGSQTWGKKNQYDNVIKAREQNK